MNLAGDYQDMAQSEATMPEIDTTGFETVRLQYRRWLGVEDALYDHATINADGAELWSNLDTPGGTTQHRDREWRFQDVDLSPLAADGKVTVKFHLDSDESLGFGGWSLDDVCIVGVGPAVCGDGFVTDPEQCDDGNVVDGDGCSATCTTETPATCGDGINDEVDCPTEEPGGCCSTGGHGGAGGPLLLGLATLLGLSRRRRR
ncbi:MAG: DUF4215 domain-containing protein [Myxococcales bacterium]|nr:DUF4215 domain-containing protein [Myxococcales bacterium]